MRSPISGLFEMVSVLGVSTARGVLQKNAELGARGERALQEGHLRHGLFLGVRFTVWRYSRGTEDAGRVLWWIDGGPHLQENVSCMLRTRRKTHNAVSQCL